MTALRGVQRRTRVVLDPVEVEEEVVRRGRGLPEGDMPESWSAVNVGPAPCRER